MKKWKKFACGLMAVSIIGTAGIVNANWQNDRISTGLTAERNANNLATGTPIGIRIGSAENAIRIRLRSNVVSSVNGLARDDIIEHPWTIQHSPRFGYSYSGATRTRIIPLGFMESQVEAQRTTSTPFMARVSARRSWN